MGRDNFNSFRWLCLFVQHDKKKEAVTPAPTHTDSGVTFSIETGGNVILIRPITYSASVKADQRDTPRSFDSWMLRAQNAPLETISYGI